MDINQRDFLEQTLWRQRQKQPLGPYCEWPRGNEPVERWPETGTMLPQRELWLEQL